MFATIKNVYLSICKDGSTPRAFETNYQPNVSNKATIYVCEFEEKELPTNLKQIRLSLQGAISWKNAPVILKEDIDAKRWHNS